MCYARAEPCSKQALQAIPDIRHVEEYILRLRHTVQGQIKSPKEDTRRRQKTEAEAAR
jgi:hypothetical protein